MDWPTVMLIPHCRHHFEDFKMNPCNNSALLVDIGVSFVSSSDSKNLLLQGNQEDGEAAEATSRGVLDLFEESGLSRSSGYLSDMS